MTAKKDLDAYIGANIVVIPIGKRGTVSENADYLDMQISKFRYDNPDIILVGPPQIIITPSSAGRGVTIDSIVFRRGQESNLI